MKDVSATVRRLDEEIVSHHQAIARHRVEIMQLQETRKVLMGLAEDDQHAAEAGRADARQALLAEHSKPVIVVRKTGTGDEQGTASKAAKNGTTTMHLKAEQSKSKRDYKVDSAKYGRRKGKASVSGDYRNKILSVVDAETPMSSQEIGDHLGLPRDEKSRKGMSNALYQLKVKGLLLRGADHRYVRPAVQ